MNAQTRYEIMSADRRRYMLTQHPQLQTRAIAEHYASHAIIAVDLLKLIERQNESETEAGAECIRYLVEEIKKNHLCDFGIALEWPEDITSMEYWDRMRERVCAEAGIKSEIVQ